MQIRIAEYEDLERISVLMMDVYESRMRSKYSSKGEKAFKELISLASLEKRFLSENLFYISVDGTFIKGVLELEKPCHIAFLFVEQEKLGIGSNLCTFALEKSLEEVCTVGAFEDSIGFYEHLGFIQVSQETKVHDMAFTLMAKANV